jgi:hypothetical protein
MTEDKKCTCGRSLTSKCVGWHSLSEEEWKQKLLNTVQALDGRIKQKQVEKRRGKK